MQSCMEERIVSTLSWRWSVTGGQLLLRCRRLRRAVRCAAALSKPGGFNPDAPGQAPLPALEGEGARAHAQFMTYVFDLIDGTRDSSAFEDDVRALLGARVLPLLPVLAACFLLARQQRV
jgi:hypothetical protein